MSDENETEELEENVVGISNSDEEGLVEKTNESTKETENDPVKNLDFILDVPLKVTVELGRTDIIIKDLLQLGQGSILELDKLAGEPLEILVNGKLIAKGEVVVVNEKFAIRLTDIISPIDRIENLK